MKLLTFIPFTCNPLAEDFWILRMIPWSIRILSSFAQHPLRFCTLNRHLYRNHVYNAEEFGILYVKIFFSVPITEGWSAAEHKETSTTSLMGWHQGNILVCHRESQYSQQCIVILIDYNVVKDKGHCFI